MKVRLGILAAALFIAMSCTKSYTPFHWPDVARCAPDVGNLVGLVSQLLISDLGKDKPTPAAEQQLEDLAKQHGAGVVLCLIDRLYRDWSAPGASEAPWRAAAASRARGFLIGTGTKLLPAD